MRITAIVLAGGLSRRMGDKNKLLLPVEGKPILTHVVETLLQSRLASVCVVLGHESDGIGGLLADLSLELVVNSRFREGQMTSVYAGLQAVGTRSDAVMVCLGDQPLVSTKDINFLIECYFASSRQRILVPAYGGQRGNPIVIPATLVERIISSGANLGCKYLLERHPELVQNCPMDNDHLLFDVDTPEDYQVLLNRLGIE